MTDSKYRRATMTAFSLYPEQLSTVDDNARDRGLNRSESLRVIIDEWQLYRDGARRGDITCPFCNGAVVVSGGKLHCPACEQTVDNPIGEAVA